MTLITTGPTDTGAELLALERIGVHPDWNAADVAAIVLPVVMAEWNAAATGGAYVTSISIQHGYSAAPKTLDLKDAKHAWRVRVDGYRPKVGA